MDVHGFGLGLIDARPRELIYVAASNLKIGVDYYNSGGRRGGGRGGGMALDIGVQMGSLQIGESHFVFFCFFCFFRSIYRPID